jgi:hypothetical protein
MRQQRKLAKQKAKKKAKQAERARETSVNPVLRLQNAARWPIVEARAAMSIEEKGIGEVTIVRRLPDGTYAYGAILLDIYCLGAKNGRWLILSPGEYHEILARGRELAPLIKVAPEHALKLVQSAIEFAGRFGFAPAHDARHALRLFDGVDASLCATEFIYGRDGKPFYTRGPHESLERARAISAQVVSHGGDYIVALDPGCSAMQVDDFAGATDGWEEADDEDDEKPEALRLPR